MELSEDQFLDLFLAFIEANHWSFGGGVRTIIDGYYINEDGTPGKPVWPEGEYARASCSVSRAISCGLRAKRPAALRYRFMGCPPFCSAQKVVR